MSQHISGHVGQTVSHESGPFITVGRLRVRKAYINAYWPVANVKVSPDDQVGRPGYTIIFSGGPFVESCATQEEVDKELAKLDWIFEKDYRG